MAGERQVATDMPERTLWHTPLISMQVSEHRERDERGRREGGKIRLGKRLRGGHHSPDFDNILVVFCQYLGPQIVHIKPGMNEDLCLWRNTSQLFHVSLSSWTITCLCLFPKQYDNSNQWASCVCVCVCVCVCASVCVCDWCGSRRGQAVTHGPFIRRREGAVSEVWRGRSLKVGQPVSNPRLHAGKFMNSSAESFEFQWPVIFSPLFWRSQPNCQIGIYSNTNFWWNVQNRMSQSWWYQYYWNSPVFFNDCLAFLSFQNIFRCWHQSYNTFIWFIQTQGYLGLLQTPTLMH